MSDGSISTAVEIRTGEEITREIEEQYSVAGYAELLCICRQTANLS